MILSHLNLLPFCIVFEDIQENKTNCKELKELHACRLELVFVYIFTYLQSTFFSKDELDAALLETLSLKPAVAATGGAWPFDYSSPSGNESGRDVTASA